MSKRFKPQDYFRYPRLGNRWRRPKGLQSKLRLKKGGSGMLVSVGYGTKASQRNTINGMEFAYVSRPDDLSATGAKAVIISSGVGAKKTAEIAAKAGELDIKILNMKKVKRSRKVLKAIHASKQNKAEVKKKDDEQKKEGKKQAGKEKAAELKENA